MKIRQNLFAALFGVVGGVSVALVGVALAGRDGSGSYTLPAGNPVQTGTQISTTWANNTLADIANALTASIAKDGQTLPTANLPMGGFKHTGVGDATARTSYASAGQLQDGTTTLAGSVTGTNAVTGSLSPAISAYADGMRVVVVPAGNNTGATTLALNGLTARSVVRPDTGALVSGDMVMGVATFLTYDLANTRWILANPQKTLVTSAITGVLPVANGGTGAADAATARTNLSAANAVHTHVATDVLSGTFPAINGSNLTNLTAANVTGSHTLPDGVLSTNVPLINAANTFTGTLGLTTTSTQYGVLNSSNADGAYYTLARSANPIGYFGNSKALSGGTLDSFEIYSLGVLKLFGAGGITLNNANLNDYARFSQSAVFTAGQLSVQPASEAGYGTLSIGNAVGTRKLEAIYVGTGASTAYGIAAGGVGLNASAGGGTFVLATNDLARITIDQSGNFNFKAGTVTTNNASASEVGYKGLPQNSQSVTYTTVLADANKNLHQTGASKTFTIDDTLSYPVGTALNFSTDNATGVTVTCSTAANLHLAGTATTGARTLAQYGIATALKTASGQWIITGTGIS